MTKFQVNFGDLKVHSMSRKLHRWLLWPSFWVDLLQKRCALLSFPQIVAWRQLKHFGSSLDFNVDFPYFIQSGRRLGFSGQDCG